jgi:TPR repeat protein
MFFSHRVLKCFSSKSINIYLSLSFLTSLIVLSSCASSPPVIDEALKSRALLGDAEAQYQIGELYYNNPCPWSCKEDIIEGAKWFEMAAQQGNFRAQYQLSQYYFSIKRDYSESFVLLQLPAQHGISEAQHWLGMHYGQAWGTPQNLVLAYKWIALAFEGSAPNPKGRAVGLDWLVERGSMTPDQILEGQRLAAQHAATFGKSKPLDPQKRALLEVR